MVNASLQDWTDHVILISKLPSGDEEPLADCQWTAHCFYYLYCKGLAAINYWFKYFHGWFRLWVYSDKLYHSCMLNIVQKVLNEKVTPKSLLFLSPPMARKHWVFPLTRVSAFKVPAVLKKSVLKEAQNLTLDAAILKLLGSQAMFMWRHSV